MEDCAWTAGMSESGLYSALTEKWVKLENGRNECMHRTIWVESTKEI